MKHVLPGTLAFALLGLLAWQWQDWPPVRPEVGADPALEGHVPDAPPDLLATLKPPADRDSYASIVERPLFRPDRKPEPPPDEEPAVAPAPGPELALDTLDLNAVMITPTGVSAWVKNPAQPKLQRLRLGDELAGWSVREIRDDRILLERQGEEYALVLRDYSKAPPPTAAPMPVPRRPPKAPERAVPPAIPAAVPPAASPAIPPAVDR